MSAWERRIPAAALMPFNLPAGVHNAVAEGRCPVCGGILEAMGEMERHCPRQECAFALVVTDRAVASHPFRR